MNEQSLEPFVEALKALLRKETPTFLGKNVEAGVVLLTIRDGARLRVAIATVGCDMNDLAACTEGLFEIGMEAAAVQAIIEEIPDGQVIN